MLTRQPHTRPLARPGDGVVLHSSRKLVCRAKGKKGPQKNEGVYFEYRDVEQQAVPGKGAAAAVAAPSAAAAATHAQHAHSSAQYRRKTVQLAQLND
jgi:hypothetical protein